MYHFSYIFNYRSIKHPLLCVFILAVIEASAQKNVTQEIDSLLDQAWEHHVSIQLLPALETAMQALDLANEHKYDKGKGEAHFMVADALFNIGLLKEGLKHLDDIQKTEYYKKRPIVQSESYRLKARSYTKLKLYQLALTEYHKQQKFIESLEQEQKTMSLLYLYSNLTYTFKEMGEIDSVEKYSFLQLDLLRTLNEKDVYFHYVNTYNDLGILFTTKGDYDKAQQYLDKSLAIVEKFNVPVFFNTMIFFGRLEKEKGNHKEAAAYYHQALANTVKIGDRDALRDQYKQFSDFYREHLLDQEKANQYLLKYTQLNDSLERENRQVIDQALRHVLSAKDKEEDIKKNRYMVSMVAILTLAVLMFIYFSWRARNNRNILKEREVTLHEKEMTNKVLNNAIQKNKFNDLLVLARNNSPEFLTLFTELYPEFIQALKALDPKIRNTELEFCAMAFLNFSTKNIAEYTFVTTRAVQIRKNRFRKKFGIPSDVDFNIWMRDRV